MLELLELEDIADDVIGPPLGGINPDQRKRLTIAVVRHTYLHTRTGLVSPFCLRPTICLRGAA